MKLKRLVPVPSFTVKNFICQRNYVSMVLTLPWKTPNNMQVQPNFDFVFTKFSILPVQFPRQKWPHLYKASISFYFVLILHSFPVFFFIFKEYRDPLIVFLMREPSIFRGIAVSLFWLVIGSQIEIDVAALNWVLLTYGPNFKTCLQ